MTYDRLVGFGEAMLRFTPALGRSVETATSFDCSVGGAELNGLIAAARSGMPATWVTALPDNPLGAHVRRHARANAVDVVCTPLAGDAPSRLGLYFLEMTPPPRPARITYDRRGSAFAHLDPDAVSWSTLLDDRACLYLTGITPPLGTAPELALAAAQRTAAAVGATVAVDANYRSGLWPREAFAGWLAAALPQADVVAASPQDLRDAGLSGDDPTVEAVERYGLRALLTTTKELHGDQVHLTLRVMTAEGEHELEATTGVVDQIGAGDALFGTFLAALPAGDVEAAARRALEAAVTCYGLFGDALVADPWDSSDRRRVIR